MIEDRRPAILVSYAYINRADEWRTRGFRDWALDSGAFTVHNAGKSIDLDAYIDAALQLNADPHLIDIFALDVIGDWKAGLANAERMRARGLNVVPAYHQGEPWHVLETLAREYDKIAFGGFVAARPGGFSQRCTMGQKLHWLSECMNRVWPKRVHAFGITSKKLLMQFPFESSDSSTWQVSVSKYGSWSGIGHARINLRDSKRIEAGLRIQVDYYLKMEAEVRGRWRGVHESAGVKPFTLRLAMTPNDVRKLYWLGGRVAA